MNAATVAATIRRAGVPCVLQPPTTGALDIETGRVVGRTATPRVVATVTYADAPPTDRSTSNGTPTRRVRVLLATVDTDGAALPDPQGWTLTDARGTTWTLASVAVHERAGVALAYECRGTA